MRYLPLRDFENVTSVLNFDTDDCHVTGACDLYTTKAVGAEKKLIKNIKQSLESQHESLVQLSASLSPPNAKLLSLNLSQSSPFGPLSEPSSRSTFAYLIATLNASHPDYDFSQILKPADFRKEKNLKLVMNTIDDTLQNLRPRARATLGIPAGWAAGYSAGGPQMTGAGQGLGHRMWRVVDKEMTLRDCEIFCYAPDEDPFDGEESALWSMHYFFFNKTRKRVCYMHLRGFSIASHSPVQYSTPASSRSKRAHSVSRTHSFSGMGAKKRARYWLGDKAENYIASSWDAEDGDDFDISAAFDDLPGDDEVDADTFDISDDFSSSAGFSDSSDVEEFVDQSQLPMANSLTNSMAAKSKKGIVRNIDDHIAETMEV